MKKGHDPKMKKSDLFKINKLNYRIIVFFRLYLPFLNYLEYYIGINNKE
jgi:hypothetical protein